MPRSCASDRSVSAEPSTPQNEHVHGVGTERGDEVNEHEHGPPDEIERDALVVLDASRAQSFCDAFGRAEEHPTVAREARREERREKRRAGQRSARSRNLDVTN